MKSVIAHAANSHEVSSGDSTSLILPVYVSFGENSTDERLVYALLDVQSHVCFISQRTSSELNASGVKSTIRLSTLSTKDEIVSTEKISDIYVRGYNSTQRTRLPPIFTRPEIPVNRASIPTHQTAKMWPHLECIADEMAPLMDVEVGLLIGRQCRQLIVPRDIKPAQEDGPFGQKTSLGWSIIGAPCEQEEDHNTCFRVSVETDICGLMGKARIEPCMQVKELFTPADIIQMEDTHISTDSDFKYSYNDTLFLNMMKSGIKQMDNGHYSMPLPLKQPVPRLPNNQAQAISRLNLLKKKFNRDEKFRSEYTSFMEEIIAQGYAETVNEQETQNDSHNVWYIPHHGVFHPKKKKIRVVFDCSARFETISLNDLLLPGPDLTNDLLGVLLRFRKEQTAITCDIQKMFYQFEVHQNDRDYLRFMWWPKGDTSLKPRTFRMTVHLFGASSSPGCSNYGLKQAAQDGEAEFGTQAANFVRSNFYVDDGLASTSSVKQAIDLVSDTKALCEKAGIRLHKFATNSLKC